MAKTARKDIFRSGLLGLGFALFGLGTAQAQFIGMPPGSGGGGGGSPGGSNGQIQYNNSGAFGGTATGTGVLTALGSNLNGSGALVATTSPTLVTPILGAATGTSLALGGATLGSNALAVTGPIALSGSVAAQVFISTNGNTTALSGSPIEFWTAQNRSGTRMLSTTNNAGIAGIVSFNSAIGFGADAFFADTFLTRLTTASLQLGAAANGTPVANTLSIGESATGTNIVGANGTIRPGNGTGSGGGGSLFFDVAAAGTTGSTANTYAHALTIANTGAATFSGALQGTSGLNGGLPIYGSGSANNYTEVIGSTVFGLNTSNIQWSLNRSGSGRLDLTSAALVTWSSSATAAGNPGDSGISRLGAGSLAIGNGTAGDFSGSLKLATLTTTGLLTSGAANLNGALYIGNNITAWNAGYIGFSSSTGPNDSNADVRLYRDAANTLALRNGTNAQTLNVYNTFTDASNYERGVFDWAGTANVLTIGTKAAGTGTTRNMQFVIGGVNKLDYGVTTASTWTVGGQITSPYVNVISGIYLGPSLTGFISSNSATVLKIDTNGSYTNLSVGSTNIGVVTTKATTVATLPAAATAGAGARAYVTDATSCTFLGALTGSGSTNCPVVSNGTSWVGG